MKKSALGLSVIQVSQLRAALKSDLKLTLEKDGYLQWEQKLVLKMASEGIDLYSRGWSYIAKQDIDVLTLHGHGVKLTLGFKDLEDERPSLIWIKDASNQRTLAHSDDFLDRRGYFIGSGDELLSALGSLASAKELAAAH